MKPKPSPRQKQGNFLYQDLLESLDPKYLLLLLAKRVSREIFEREFASLFADFGRPAKLIRLMIGLFFCPPDTLPDSSATKGTTRYYDLRQLFKGRL